MWQWKRYGRSSAIGSGSGSGIGESRLTEIVVSAVAVAEEVADAISAAKKAVAWARALEV